MGFYYKFITIINMEFTCTTYISILYFIKLVQHLVINLLVVRYLGSLCIYILDFWEPQNELKINSLCSQYVVKLSLCIFSMFKPLRRFFLAKNTCKKLNLLCHLCACESICVKERLTWKLSHKWLNDPPNDLQRNQMTSLHS